MLSRAKVVGGTAMWAAISSLLDLYIFTNTIIYLHVSTCMHICTEPHGSETQHSTLGCRSPEIHERQGHDCSGSGDVGVDEVPF